MGGRYEERERILQAVTLSALSGSHDDVLQILPRLSDTSIVSILGDLKQPSLLSAAIFMGSYRHTTCDFLLRTYDIDLSVRDASGANALILASKSRSGNMAEMICRILEEREDLLNSQDFLGRTSLSWAAENVSTSAEVLLGYKDIQLELNDDEGLGPIDYLMRTGPGELQRKILRLMVPILDYGINRLDRHGCTLLHALIDVSYSQQPTGWFPHNEHWEKLEHYEGRKIFERKQRGKNTGAETHRLQDLNPDYSVYRATMSFFPQYHRYELGHILRTNHVSAAEIRSSPCKCGIGTIFLAISTENEEMVENLLELYPDLVNDTFFDGSSPLDLANCILSPRCRQKMIDLILSKNPLVETYEVKTRTVGISESNPVEPKEGGYSSRPGDKPEVMGS